MNPSLILLGLLLLSACNGSPEQGLKDYETAVRYMRGTGIQKDEKKAMTYLLKAAQQGNDRAELAMGYFYLKGTGGVKQDGAKAVEFFVKSAEHGNRDGQYNAGLAYARGEGVTKDYAKAYEWFLKAAYQDDAGAQYNLGVMAVNGEGVVADPLIAYVWFQLADEKGYNGAKEGMKTARTSMTADQIKEIDREYAKILRKIKKPSEAGAPALQPL